MTKIEKEDLEKSGFLTKEEKEESDELALIISTLVLLLLLGKIRKNLIERQTINLIEDHFNLKISRDTLNLINKSITFSQWQTSMVFSVKYYLLISQIIGYGGYDSIS